MQENLYDGRTIASDLTNPDFVAMAESFGCVAYRAETPEELAKVPQTPGSLRAALQALEQDHDFLLRGDVFTPDVIETWIDYKMEREVVALELRPHPYEFALYYDI